MQQQSTQYCHIRSDSSDEEAGLSGHTYHLRGSAVSHIASSREQSGRGRVSRDSSKLSRENVSRQHWKQAELNLPTQAQRCVRWGWGGVGA